ncbi:M20 aminoacylase family protein [Sneathiella sp. HT1-7]|uniref:M20 aminoacylase family protein n=1 Tax=Sneathiella sp. HT1-7 TaxID=2887192 RepID=UPI001D157FCC|nr:M20 aminoacylase family protein [Sneathiella sp. HT1-7]MCC3306390.1 M20 family metallopeptidase [Sneathiella sp. HT1-7]
MTLYSDLGLEADPEFFEELVTLRRDIHKYPETAFQETRTAAIVAAELEKAGISVNCGLAATGVVGTLKGKTASSRTIGLRADMDALFIHEKNEFEYKSVNAGKMHACGHDGHTAMLLGAAKYLAKHRNFSGTVHFIFQPAEESEGGARVMIEQGLFDKFPCDVVYGMHNMPGLGVGKFVIKSGPMMAAGDTWQVEFVGTGGHGAAPHLATDPTMASAMFMSNISTVVARNVPAVDSAVISIGHIAAGEFNSPNIIPSTVLVRGTARSYTPETRDNIEARLSVLAQSSASAYECQANYKFIRRYPPLINWPDQTATAIDAATLTTGHKNVDGKGQALGGSEDFAFMLEKVPGAYILVGNGDKESNKFVHNSLYDFNDEALPYGVAYWVNLVGVELGGVS